MSEPTRVKATRYFRGHPEMVMFLVALPLFLGGLASLLIDQFRPDTNVSLGTNPPESTTAAKASSIGPSSEQPLPVYIESRKASLRSRATKSPRTQVFAVVSFDAYKKASEVGSFLASVKLQPAALQMRIPLPGFQPITAAMGDRSVAAVLEDEFGKKAVERLRDELRELEEIIPTVTDQEYKEVYRADAAARRAAIAALEGDPAVVFAVIVKGSYAELAKGAAKPGIRVVDAAGTPDMNFDNHDFYGILPEDTEKATFVREPL